MKILITGVLGYIGRELCELYKNSADEIIGIDNNFIPDKVAWLIENDIKFYLFNNIQNFDKENY